MHSVEVTTSFCTEGATPAEHLWEGMVSAGADAYKQPRAWDWIRPYARLPFKDRQMGHATLIRLCSEHGRANRKTTASAAVDNNA
jgi:hypothetical protein